jgi:beta-aspartyl-peptidase (threonine type)
MSKNLGAIISVPLIIGALALGASAGLRNTLPEPAVKEIRAVLDRQMLAWNRGDIEGFMQGYWRSPDLTFFSDNTTVSGWDETLGRYRTRYTTGGNQMGKLEFLDLKIELLGPSAAFVRGRFHLTESGNESTGLFTLTFRKLPGGWKIVHDHTSTAS